MIPWDDLDYNTQEAKSLMGLPYMTLYADKK